MTLICLDGTRPLTRWETELIDAKFPISRKPSQRSVPQSQNVLIAITKVDRLSDEQLQRWIGRILPGQWRPDDGQRDDGTYRLVTRVPHSDDPSPGGSQRLGIWYAVATSGLTGRGLDALKQCIAALFAARSADESAVVASTAARCRGNLEAARAAIGQAITLAEVDAGEELIADALRASLDDLGQVVGAIYTDDILDRVFSRFCIGK